MCGSILPTFYSVLRSNPRHTRRTLSIPPFSEPARSRHGTVTAAGRVLTLRRRKRMFQTAV
ncbi:hypothetical protein AHFPHNDE_00391 [Pseudomonas sp. MM227]|nr:hypothetical protein AHFPHNDE_00391 [Pseudomonas sp. MM227]